MANYPTSQTIDMGIAPRHRRSVRSAHAKSEHRTANTGVHTPTAAYDRRTESAATRTRRTSPNTHSHAQRVVAAAAYDQSKTSSYRAPMRRKRTHPLRLLVRAMLVSILLVVCAASAYYGTRGFALYEQAAAATSLDNMAAAIKSNPEYVAIDDLPETYLDAVVSVEDRRFYLHPGFDILATGRALVNDLRAGSIVEGGSTITQQLAKNEYFTQEQTIERKIAEVFMAFDIERHFTKTEILELYVNSIYFGNGYYGIGQAAQGYFGKSASELTDYEATMLAGTPNAPSAYAPTTNPDLAAQRQRQVVEKMVEDGMLSPDAAAAIEAQANAWLESRNDTAGSYRAFATNTAAAHAA